MTALSQRADRIFETIDRNPWLHNRGLGCFSLRMLDWLAGDFLAPHVDVMAVTRYGKEPARHERSFDCFLSTEKMSRVRTDSGMHELGSFVDEGLRVLHEIAPESGVLCYQSSAEIERAAINHPGLRLLNPPAALVAMLNRKTWVRREMQSIGVPVIPGVEVRLAASLVSVLVRRHGLPLVVSLDESAAGSGVHLVTDEAQFRDLVAAHHGAAATVMPFIDGRSLSMAGVVTRSHVLLGEASLQIIGEPALTGFRFGWCGNDFSGSLLREEEVAQMRAIVERVGRWLTTLEVAGERGFRGIFGIDFISDGRRVYFTEINPRFLGTTALMADRQRELGRIPVSFLHLVPFLPDAEIDDDFAAAYNAPGRPLDVAQLCLHNVAGDDVIVEAAPEPGRYVLGDGRLRFLGPADALSETQSYDEVVIAGEIPLEGTRLLKTSDEFCKVFTYEPMLGSDGRTLNARGRALVEAVRGSFRLRPAAGG